MARTSVTTRPIPTPPVSVNNHALLLNWAQQLKVVLDRLVGEIIGADNEVWPRQYVLSTLPGASSINEGQIVYVSDAVAGQKFKGSDGSSWVNLG